MRVTRLPLFVSALLAGDINVTVGQAEQSSTQDIQNLCASSGVIARLGAHDSTDTSGSVVGSAGIAWE